MGFITLIESTARAGFLPVLIVAWMWVHELRLSKLEERES